MHELSVALAIERTARAELAELDGERLTRIRVTIGELSGVEPDLLGFAWEAVAAEEGSPCAGCRLEIRRVSARQTCASCGDVPERQPGSWLRLCPACHGPLRVEGGRELELTELTIEDLETTEARG